jgi:hypothetical protein
MTEEEILALKIQAAAATKLAQTTLEFAINIAKIQGLSLDLEGAAQAHLNSRSIANLNPVGYAIEQEARVMVSEMLLAFARKVGDEPKDGFDLKCDTRGDA